MERVRKFSIKYVVVALLLALALPFFSFAAENLSLDESQFSLIWNARNFNYFQQRSNGSLSNWPGTYEKFYMFDSSSRPQDYNGLSLYGRLFSFSSLNTDRISIVCPINLLSLDSFSSDFFYGLYYFNSNGVAVNALDYVDYSSSYYKKYPLSSDSFQFDLISRDSTYFFYDQESVPTTGSGSSSFTGFRSFRRLTVYANTESVYQFSFSFTLSEPLPENGRYYFFFGMASDAEIGAQDGQSQVIINGISGIQGSIDSMVSEMQQSNGQILDQIGNVLYELEGDAVTASDADQLLADSISKSEELDQLGDALASVPKPDVNSITSAMNPSTVLQNNDSASVQLAMAPLYSWDKLLSILGVLVAVFSISYILFGKKK